VTFHTDSDAWGELPTNQSVTALAGGGVFRASMGFIRPSSPVLNSCKLSPKVFTHSSKTKIAHGTARSCR
jgi:hypothetical protein